MGSVVADNISSASGRLRISRVLIRHARAEARMLARDIARSRALLAASRELLRKAERLESEFLGVALPDGH
jgi:hypothetical protein